MRGRQLALLTLALGATGATRQTPPAGTPVQAAFQHVDFHLAELVVLRIEFLRGKLLPTRADRPVTFDDPRSFILAIDTARVSLSTRSMGELFNRHVFAYPGAPLRGLRPSVEGKRLRLRGRMNGMPFSILSDLRVTQAGELRLSPVRIKAYGIPVKGVMGFLGMKLERMLDLRKAVGVRVEANDLVISPTAILPPPLIRGHLASVELRDSVLLQVFRPEQGPAPAPLVSADTSATNFMYFRGGSLRIGLLTMTPADLLILDGDPSDRFDFFLSRYNDQLVAGFSRNTRAGGLITVMPDLGESLARRAP